MPQKYTENKKISNKKWDAANLDRISVVLPKGRKAVIKLYAEANGDSINGFIGKAVDEALKRKGWISPTG